MSACRLIGFTAAALVGWMLATGSGPAVAAEEDYTLTSFWTDAEPVDHGKVRAFAGLMRLDDGSLILVGDELSLRQDLPFRSVDYGLSSLMVVAIGRNGSEQWRRSLPISESFGEPHLAAAPDGGVFVCDGGAHYYRLDREGAVVWHVEQADALEATCQTMDYHPAGLLLVAGDRITGRSTTGGFESAVSLTAYDAIDGHVRWFVSHRPFDGRTSDLPTMVYGTKQAWIMRHGEEIEWFGWGSVWQHRGRDYIPWSLLVDSGGTILQETSLQKFMAARSLLDGTILAIAPPDRLLMFNRDVIDADLIVWSGGNWRQPRYRATRLAEAFGWTWREPVPELYAAGGSDESLTLLFYRESTARNPYDRLDIVTMIEPPDRRIPSREIVIALPDFADERRIIDLKAAADNFALGHELPIYLLIAEHSAPWHIDKLLLP